MGSPMPDNAFFDITIPNAPEAQAESGNYLYRISVRNVDTNLAIISNFKIQVVGPGTSLFIFPGDQPFGYESTCRGATPAERAVACDILYPTFAADPVGCTEPFNEQCINDPACCYFSTYNGNFDFFFNEDEGRLFIDFWDGDLDFGIKVPGDGPPFEDTDDPNTPPGLPVFSDVGNTNEQTSAGALPPDDLMPVGSGSIFLRVPNIIYELIDPNGVAYQNNNPSATNEWELFQLNTESGCAPDICDYEVTSIPQGIWHIRIQGMDLWNINFIRAFDKILGVDPGGNPVPPLSPDLPPPSTVPTFSEWGMVAVFFLLGTIGLYHLRRKKNADASSSQFVS